MDRPTTSAFSTSIASTWEQALVVGNGMHGAMLFGAPGSERVVLSRAGLFLPTEPPLDPPPLAPRLEDVRALIRDGLYAEAGRLAVDAGRDLGMDRLVWTDPFVPAAYLSIDTTTARRVLEYRRNLDLRGGTASVSYDAGGVHREIEARAPRDDGTLLVRLRSSAAIPELSLRMGFPALSPAESRVVEDAIADSSCSVELLPDGAVLSFRVSFARQWPGSLRGYVVRATVTAPTAAAGADGELVVRNASDVMVASEVVLEYDEGSSRRIRSGAGPGGGNRHGHPNTHRDLMDRCTIDLAAGGCRGSSTEELRDRFSEPEARNALFEKIFAAGRSAIVSSMGELPPTLTGIWGGSWAPAWSGDYTANGNLQTAIDGVLPLGLEELLVSYFDYLESLLPDFRSNAKRLYGARGVYVPSRMSSHGLMNHYSDVYAHIYWTVGAAWAAHFYFDYYRHTQDLRFLRERALPFMLEAVSFYEDFLGTGNGPIEFSPSYSPENSPANFEGDIQVTRNATMDIDLVRELLANTSRAHEILGLENDRIAVWQSMLDRLPGYDINPDGAISEWADPSIHDRYDHRHASHLYRLYYERPAVLDADPAIEAAFAEALGRKLEYRRHEEQGAMAFGLVQLGHAAISLRDPEATEEILLRLAGGYWTNSLTSTHDRGNIFNTDICGGLPNLMARAVVDGTERTVDLLPALPTSWRAGMITGVRLRGGFVCDVRWDAGRLVEASIEDREPPGRRPARTLRVRCAGRSVDLSIDPDTRIVLDGELRRI